MDESAASQRRVDLKLQQNSLDFLQRGYASTDSKSAEVLAAGNASEGVHSHRMMSSVGVDGSSTVTGERKMTFLEELGRSLDVTKGDQGQERRFRFDSSISTDENHHGAGAGRAETFARTGSSRDFTQELEELFEEMRRLVGFERLREQNDDGDGATGGDSGSMLSGGQVGKEVVRHELRMLITRLKKVSPFENEAEMRGLERRLAARTEENRKLRHHLKEAEYIRRRKEEVDAKVILQMQAQNKQLKYDLNRYRKARRDVMADNDRLKGELEEALSVRDKALQEAADAEERMETARERVRVLEIQTDELSSKNVNGTELFKRKYEEQLAELRLLRKQVEANVKMYESEHRTANEYKRLNTQLEGAKRRLESTVKDLRSELVEEHHRSISAGMEAKQVKAKYEELRVEFVEVKEMSAEQQAQLQARIRELYEVQESLLAEIKGLQLNTNANVVRSITAKTVQLRNIANVIFKKRSTSPRADDESTFLIGDEPSSSTSLAGGLASEFGNAASTADSSATIPAPETNPPRSLIDPSIAGSIGGAATIGASVDSTRTPTIGGDMKGGGDRKPKAKATKKASPYEQSLELSKEKAVRDLEEVQKDLLSKEEQIKMLQSRLTETNKKLGETERKLLEANQRHVKEVRKHARPEISEAQTDIERHQRNYRNQSLFSS